MKSADSILRVGGVGTGRIFQHAHCRAYPRFLDTAWLTGFFDLNKARAQQARDKYEALLREIAAEKPQLGEAVLANIAELRCYDSLDELLDRVDLIDVATHARGRMSTAIAAMEKGVHVMVEKPMARTWIEADRAARVAAANPGVYLQLNDDNAFDPKYRVLNALLEQGAIGEPQNMLLIRGGRDAKNVLRLEVSPLSSGGGSLMAYGSHGLAGAWAALGLHLKPVTVEAVKIGAYHPERVLQGEPFYLEVDDVAQLKIRFEDAEKGSWATVFLEATLSGGTIGMDPVKSGAQNAGYLRIIGDQGAITTSSAREIRIERWDGGETIVPLIEYVGETVSFEDEFGTMFRCVRTGVPPEINVDFGADVIAICGAAYLSAIRETAVTLDEFKEYSRRIVDKYGDNEEADDAIVLELLRPYKRVD